MNTSPSLVCLANEVLIQDGKPLQRSERATIIPACYFLDQMHVQIHLREHILSLLKISLKL